MQLHYQLEAERFAQAVLSFILYRNKMADFFEWFQVILFKLIDCLYVQVYLLNVSCVSALLYQ